MVKSRKYAIVTAALALILVAAVVLTVVLTGNGAFYNLEQEGTASGVDLTIGSDTGSVDASYVFNTLKDHSNKKGDNVSWSASELVQDGNISYYPATLDNSFYLITQTGAASEAANTGRNITATNNYYQLYYNGAYYRFTKNAGYNLFLGFETYMTATNYSRNAGNYGLAVQASGTISYDPNNTFDSFDFNATFDGAGVTLSMSQMLMYWNTTSTGRYGWIKWDCANNEMILNTYGLNAGGLLIGSICNGTLTNFKLTDANANGGGRTYSEAQTNRPLSGHYYEENSERTGSAFGGIVGYAGPSAQANVGTTHSTLSNISCNFTKNVLHMYTIPSSGLDRQSGQDDMYTGGAIGFNASADVSNVTINFNSSVWDQCNVRVQDYQAFAGDASGYKSTSHIGTFIGLEWGNNTIEKIAIYGSSSSAFICSDRLFQGTGVGHWSKVHTYIGGFIGSTLNDTTLNGILFSYPFANSWYPQQDNRTDGAQFKRGVFVGRPEGTVTYQNIYMTDMVVSGASGATIDSIGNGQSYTCYPTASIINGHNTIEAGSNASYSSGFWFDGNDSTNKRFIYADDAVISSIQFSDDPDYMVEISAPSSQEGVMWDVNYVWNNTSTNINVTNSTQLVFMQNTADNVKIKELAVQGNTDYVEMATTYASSYTYSVSNGVNGNGDNNKIYNGTQVSYPTLEVNVNSEISSYGKGNLLTSNGYMTLGLNTQGFLTVFRNNGTTGVGVAIDRYYDATGASTLNANIDSIIGSILQLQYNSDGGYQTVEKSGWSGMVNANTYQWSALSTFAFTEASGARKYVFVPDQGSSAQVQITQRPVYLDVVNDSVPYIGQGYALEQGSGGTTFGTVNYTFGTTANDNLDAIIGNDSVSTLATISGTTSAVDAGDYNISATSLTGGSANNYRLEAAPNNKDAFTITPADVTLNIVGGTMTYGTQLADRAAFMNLVHYELDFDDATQLTAFASRDNITLNLNLRTGNNSTNPGQLLFEAASGSDLVGSAVFAYNFPVGAYEVLYENITGSGARNYNVTMGTSQPFNINPATLNIDLGEIPDFTYGDKQAPDTPAYTVGGLVQGDQIITWAPAYETAGDNTPYTTTPFGAGSYVATAEVTEINSPGSLDGIENYRVVSNTQAFDVSKRDTAVQFDYDQSELIYKGSAYTFTATVLTNAAFNDGDSIANKVTFQAYSDVNRQNKVDATNAGTYYPGAVSEILSANYNVTGVLDANGYEWTSFEVLKATITVNAQTQTIEYSGSEVVYDTSNVTIEGEVSGEEELIRNAIAILYNGSSAVPVDAGTYSVTVQIDGLANYNAVTQAFTGTFVINPMQIVINVTDAVEGVITREYSGVNMPTFPYTITDGDGEEIHDTLPVTLSYKQGENTVSSLRNVGSYTVTFTYDGSNGNYAKTNATITYTVTPKNLTITVDGVTDGAATQVYNKEVYDPTYTLPGIVSGDVVNPVFTATGGGEIKNAGEYAITVTLDNSNYTLSGNTSYTLTISKFVITPQEGISSLLINADDLSADYYEDFFTAVVYDADGSDVSDQFAGNITFTLNDGNYIAAEGGDYPVTMTVTLPAGFDAINYEVAEGLTFTAHIYRISLGLGFNGIEGSAVTYGDPFSLLAAFTAVGVEGVLTVDNSGNIDVDDIIDDVTALQVTSASLGLTGTTFKPASVDVDNLSTSIEELFTSGVYDQSNMADAGSYTATISVTVHVTYSNKSTKDITFTMPFAYQVERKVIGVTLSDVSAYYTDTIDEELLRSGLSFTDGNDSFVTVTSAVLNSAPNADTYTYAIQLNEQTGGYYNYALPADSIGNINVQKLTLKVTVDDNSVQYGYAPTQGASATVEVYRGDALVEDTTAIASEYSYVFTSDKSIGDGVGEGKISATVTCTENFTQSVTSGVLTITPRELTIAPGNISMTYSSASLPAIAYTISGSVGLYGSDTLPVISGTLMINSAPVTAINRLNADTYAFTLSDIKSDNANYAITSATEGTLTVNPYQITSVTWKDPAGTLTYKGTTFTSEELYTVEDFTHTNGDVVTFTVNYSDTVKNAGNYTAAVAVASVTNGSESVNNGNFSVTGIASKSFSVAKANLTITAVGDVEAVEGAVTYTATFNNREQTIAQNDITFSYGNRTYNVDDDGALSVSIAYQQNGVTASTVNVGAYNVVVTISGDNFANARLTNVTMVIEQWVLNADTLAQVTDIDIPTGVMYDSQPHGATLVFNDVLNGFNAQYTFTYTNEEGEAVQPVNAGDYTVTLVIDSANVYYATAPDANEGVITIAPTNKFTLSASVPTSTGLDANQVYYSGAPIIPNAQAVITLAGEVTQLPITDSSAFNFTFYELLSQSNGGVDLSTLVSGVDAGRYYVNDDPSATAVSSGSYYVFVEFNRDGAYSGNYAPGNTWITNGDGSLTVMVITQGIMSIRMGNVSTDYNGLVGYNGRDVIYSTGTGADIRYWINTDIIQFTGVDLAGMDDLTYDLKTGDIVITVAYNYGVSTTTGEQLFTDLYTYTWAYDPNGNNGEGIRETPVKTFLDKDTNDKQEQISGPYIGSNGFAVYDFGYAGYNADVEESVAALYRISVSVDNTEGSGSEYSSAQEVETDENGPIIIDGVAQMIQVPHTASGSVTVNPATIDFSMFYTSSFYNDGNDALGGEYSELNTVAKDQITDEEARDIADYIMRGIAIPTGGELLTMGYQGSDTANVTTTGYTMLLNNVEYNFEVLAADKITIKVTDSNGIKVYSFANGTSSGSGIVNAGEYTFTFTFDAMPGRYESFSYTAMFIQQAAEYHITVEQNEGANLSTQFGTEFNLQGLADQLNVKIELGEGDYTTNTGKYTAFEEAVEAAGGNMSALASFIKLVGDDGSVSSEYGGVTSPVGSYFIYYVYTSINPNLEIVMETANSMITVTQAAPEVLVNSLGAVVGPEGVTLTGQPYTPNTSWNNAVLEQVGVGIEYKPLTAPEGNGTHYTTKNVRINTIEYSADGQHWTGVENISSVGSYRITVAADDANLTGALKGVYIFFQVTKIDAQANVVINSGNSDLVLDGEIYVATFNGTSHGVGANVTAGGNEVTASSLQGTINILVSTVSADGEYVNIKEAPIVTAGSYWVKVTVEGSENYDVTPSAPVQITINKATPTIRFETDGYSVEYSISGNTISSDDFTFELNGALAPMITANADIYYIKATFGDDGATSTAISAAQTEIAEMVNAFVASGESNIAAWLAARQEEGQYTGYEFTSVNGAPAAANVGNYFPVVIFSGDENYNRSGELVANIPHPYMEVTPAVLTLTTSKTGRSPVSVTYGSKAPKTITENVTTYINHWFQHGSSELTTDELAQIRYTATLETMNQYSVGNPVGTIANAYVLSITDFESDYNNYTYIAADYYVDIEVTPAEVTFDLANVSVSLTSDIADQQAVKLTSEGYTFERVYNGSAFGPLELTYDGEKGLDVIGTGAANADSAKSVNGQGLGTYGIFDISASGGYVQEAVSSAGSYTGSVTITLNNSNYDVTGLGEGNTLTIPVNLVIDKAILRITFDYLAYTVDEMDPYTEYSESGVNTPGGEQHLGWYEYYTIYTGRNFDYNNRVIVTSYCQDENGALTKYGAYAGGVKLSKLSEEGGIDETDGASGNLAAVGQYNIHLTLNQLAANYKFIDSAGSTVGVDASGNQADLTALDINVNIGQSPFVAVSNTLGDKLFPVKDGVLTRYFDGTNITASFLKGFLRIEPYKVDASGALTGTVPLSPDRDYAQETITNNVQVTITSDGDPVTSAMYVGDYVMSATFNNASYSMKPIEYAFKIAPTPKITSNVTVKGATKRTYNGLDLVPNISLTISVTDYNRVTHTIAVPSFTVNVTYKQTADSAASTFSYGVKNGVADMTQLQGNFRNAGTYTVTLGISNANTSVTRVDVETEFEISRRSLDDPTIRSSYIDLFNYRTRVNEGKVEAVPVSEDDLNVIVTYNRTTSLVLGEDFEIDFGKDGEGMYTGHYTFDIVGKGNYSGKLEGREYSIGASVGIAAAPDAITYGSDSLKVMLEVNSLGTQPLEGSLTVNFSTGSSSRIVDGSGKTMAQLGVPEQITINSSNMTGSGFAVTFTGLGALNAGDYYLYLVFECSYNGITTQGEISSQASGDVDSKVTVSEAEAEVAAQGVTATITSVNSTSVTFNIKGAPNSYEYSVDGGSTWYDAVKGDNTISDLESEHAFSIMLRINDDNYAHEGVNEYPLSVALSGTTTADVDAIIAEAEDLASGFNVTGFARYSELLQSISAVSSGDLAARGDEIDAALAEVEEAKAEYVEDLQAAIDSAVSAAEKAAGKASGASAAATAGVVAGGVAMPVLGIGLIFAAARKRKNKEDDLND